jgi:hypothetical protein
MCTRGQVSTPVKVTVRANYSQTSLNILEASQDQQINNGLSCSVGLSVGAFNYTVNGNQLFLSDQQTGASVTLNRN